MSPTLVSDLRASDISVVITLTERAKQLAAHEQPQDEEVRKEIERRIEMLDDFVAMCQFVRSELAKQLDEPANPPQS
ncbi:MAG TPA: hypothetical protein VFU09_11695 [Candidatus Udaeobacter sp.]|nr:hypothetical protein [Candidatus Udaeobacter sp.]